MSTTAKGVPAVTAFRPSNAQVIGFLQQMALFGQSTRFKQLDRREAHFKTVQYVHQEVAWDGRDADMTEAISVRTTSYTPGTVASEAPPRDGLTVTQKRPTAPSNIVRLTVKRFTGFLLSEGRKPRIQVTGDPDTEAFLEAVREEAGFWATMRDARDKGGSMGSVVVTVHLRDGEFAYEVHNSKHCTPLWKDRRRLKLQGLLIMWLYPREVPVYDKDKNQIGTKIVDMIYRRIITEEEDTIYKEVSTEDVAEKGWEPVAAQTVPHGLGFFPGVWIQNHACSDEIDGDPDCEGGWATAETDDRLIAQCNKGTLNNLDPTVITATDPQETAALSATGGLSKGSEYGIEVGKSGRASFLEMTGAGVEIGLKLHQVLKQNFCDLTGLVLLSDQDMAAAQSAKAIEYRFAPMIERADDLRAQYGPAILELTRITERIARRFLMAEPMTLADGRTAVFKIRLPPRVITVVEGSKSVDRLVEHKLGAGGYTTLKWGAWFAPTKDDEQKTIANASSAHQGGFVDRVTAARTVAPIYGVQDVDGTVAKAQDELEQEASRMTYGGGGEVPFNTPIEEQTPAAGAGGRP